MSTINEIIAPQSAYLTQKEENPAGGRVYITRRTLLPSESADDWRVATADEKAEYERMLEEQMNAGNENK